jgi:hypothetical protein
MFFNWLMIVSIMARLQSRILSIKGMSTFLFEANVGHKLNIESLKQFFSEWF